MNGVNAAGVPFALAFGDAATLAGTSAAGSTVVSAPGDWSVAHTPVAATVATITKAAGTGTTRHICTKPRNTLFTGGPHELLVVR